MSLEFLSHVMNLGFDAQHKLWGGAAPWRFHNVQVRLLQPEIILRKQITVDPAGHITRLKETVLRPCLGSPTAFLIHGPHQYAKGRNGPYLTRCGGCKAREICHYTAKMRLRASSEITEAWDSWEIAGGERAMVEARKAKVPYGIYNKWGDLLGALKNHGPFTSVNDQRIIAHVETKRAAAKIKDAERQRQKRLQERMVKIRSGGGDDGLRNLLWRHATHRRVLFNAARQVDGAPPWLTKCAPEGGRFTAMVWEARMSLECMRQKGTAYGIANYLVEHRKVPTENVNSLRSKVATALQRIGRLETCKPAGRSEPIWEKVSADDMIREAMQDEDHTSMLVATC